MFTLSFLLLLSMSLLLPQPAPMDVLPSPSLLSSYPWSYSPQTQCWQHPLWSLPSKPHPRAGYWSGSCLVNLILSLLSCSERRWGSLAAFLSCMTGPVPLMMLDTAPPRLKASSAKSLYIKHRYSVACLLSKSESLA